MKRIKKIFSGNVNLNEDDVVIKQIISRAISRIDIMRPNVAGLGFLEALLKDLKENYNITKK